MKKKFKKAFISGAIMATGLTVGYAASTAFQDLDAIKSNFDYILNLNTNKDAEIDKLNTKITELNTKIEELGQTQNNSGKQARIKELEGQVAGLITERDTVIAERNKLITERDGLIKERNVLVNERNTLKTERDGLVTERNTLKTERDGLDAKITELLNYTNERTSELKGEGTDE